MGHRANRLSLANLHALQELAAAALPPAPLTRQQLLDRHAVELPSGRHDHFSRAQLSRRNSPLQLGACLAHEVRRSEGLAALLEPSADITRIQGEPSSLAGAATNAAVPRASATPGTEKLRSDSRRASRTSGSQSRPVRRRESGCQQTYAPLAPESMLRARSSAP